MRLPRLREYKEHPESVRLGLWAGFAVSVPSVTLAAIWTNDPEWLRALVCLGSSVAVLAAIGWISHTQYQGVVLFDGAYFTASGVAILLVLYMVAFVIANWVVPGSLPGLVIQGP